MEQLKKFLTYTDTGIQFLLKKHRDNWRMKQNSPDYYIKHEKELVAQLRTCLLFRDREGNNFTYPGIIPYLKKFNIEVINEIVYPKLNPIEWKNKPSFEPYDYQIESANNLIKAKHGSVSLPTGSGKTYTLQLLCKNMGLRTAIVTPSTAIFNEIYDSMVELFGVDLIGTFGDGKKKIGKMFTICVAKSLTLLKEDSEELEFFKNIEHIIIDEAHTFSSETLERVCHGVFKDVPYRHLLSGTLISNTGKDVLLNSIIGPVVHEMTLFEGIQQGYLCPLNFKIIPVTSNNKKIKKDPIEAKREYFLRNDLIAQKIATIVNTCWNIRQESSLILVEELVQIQMLAKYLTIPFGYVHSGSKKEANELGLEVVKSKEQVLKFNMGETKCLVGTRTISVGVNMFPQVHTHNWVGGTSEIVCFQGVMGRSTRILEKSKFKQYHKPKTCVYIYDYSVTNKDVLKRQIEKRISYYEQAGGTIKFL